MLFAIRQGGPAAWSTLAGGLTAQLGKLEALLKLKRWRATHASNAGRDPTAGELCLFAMTHQVPRLSAILRDSPRLCLFLVANFVPRSWLDLMLVCGLLHFRRCF